MDGSADNSKRFLARGLPIGCRILIVPFSILAAIIIFSPAKTVDVGMQSEADLKVIGLTIFQYVDVHNGRLPSLADTKELAKLEYRGDPSKDPYIDPTCGLAFRTNSRFSGAELSSIQMPEFVALVYDSGKASDGKRAVLLATLDVERVDSEKWALVKRHSGI